MTKEVLQQALEALESGPDVDPIFAGETITALKAALEQPEQEEKSRWIGCGECDPVFPCTNDLAECIRLQKPEPQAEKTVEQRFVEAFKTERVDVPQVLIQKAGGKLFLNGEEIGPGTIEIRLDGLTYRASERVEVKQQAEPEQEPPTCEWSPEDDDSMPGTYRSACGELWLFIEGGWQENRVRFCHGCGGKVEAAHGIKEPKP